MFIESYFQTAQHIFEQYNLQLPLHLFLKKYFIQNKKFGSRDRKYIAELLYGLYRLGKNNEHIPLRERFLIGSFLSARLPLLFYEKVNREFAANFDMGFDDKKTFVAEKYACNFSVPIALSEGITEEQFIQNLFSVPKVFIRVRQNRASIESVLKKNEVIYNIVKEDCFSFESNIKLHELLNDEDYVVQDFASQQTGYYFSPKPKEHWWDCCTASGGKSIMLLDRNVNISLTVSDIRETVLKNFHNRMNIYGYANRYLSHVIDLTSDISETIKNKFDVIICDAPCSGSGTWARSPEQYYFFTAEKLKTFATLQQEILLNVSKYLKPQGKLFYITCSIIRDENEGLFENMNDENSVSVVKAELINANEQGGDAMFIAVLKNQV